MKSAITPVILCGGSGTRLWPRSRSAKPKPFLSLLGEETLFEAAVNRCRRSGFEKPVVVTGAAHVDLVNRHVDVGEVGEIIVEPQPRQTAAAIGLAAMRLPADAVMLVCPSDHYIGDVEGFKKAAQAAADLAEDGWLVCLAISPASPETRFGYVRRSEPLGQTAYRVEKFHEKPDRQTAERYLSSGEFAWNGGIFAFRAGDYLNELERHRPALAAELRKSVAGGEAVDGKFYPESSHFALIKPESVDYAVMENTDRAAMVLTQMEWSDVGDWPTLRQLRRKDPLGNAIKGPAQLIDSRNNLVDTDGPTVHLVGMEDVIVVVDGNDILVASTRDAERVGRLADGKMQ